MKVMITGGAGFIGSHLALKLCKEGHEVLVIDDLSLGQEKFLVPCRSFSKFKFVKGDLLDLEFLKTQMAGMNRIWHLAANSDIASGGKTTDIDLKIGTLATYNVLEAMRLNQVQELVFSSTSAIYGEAQMRPTREDYGPLLPISFYGASKLACEALCTAFSHNYEIKVWMYRFANIVGSHTTHGAIHDFIKKLKKNPSRLDVLGDGTQSKSYLHVSDCISGMAFGVENTSHMVNLFNLASSGECSVREIAEMVRDAVSPGAEIYYSGGARGWKGDVSKVELDGRALQAKGFQPQWDSKAAVKNAIKDILNDSELGMSS